MFGGCAAIKLEAQKSAARMLASLGRIKHLAI
jgi:hypothetical protein